MQLLFDNNKNPVVPTKSWKIGLEEGAENLLRFSASALVVYAGNKLASFHPQTSLEMTEAVLGGFILTWIENWLVAHKIISQAQATVVQPPQPAAPTTPETPPAG